MHPLSWIACYSQMQIQSADINHCTYINDVMLLQWIRLYALNNLQLVLNDFEHALSVRFWERGLTQISTKMSSEEERKKGRKEQEGMGEGFQLLSLQNQCSLWVLLCKVLFTVEGGDQEHKVYKTKGNRHLNIYGLQSLAEISFFSKVFPLSCLCYQFN